MWEHFELPITDPVLVFGLVMVIILVAPLLFRWMKIPGIVGLIMAGAIVGPSALNLLERSDTFVLLGDVGLLYLMFVAGLSLELNQFIKVRNRSLTFGLLSFILPMGGAMAAGRFLLDFDLASSLLLGSIVGSHTLLAYPIVRRLGIVRNPAITMATGGTLITDGLALAILAGVVASTGGKMTTFFWIQFVGLASAYIIVVMLGLPMLGRWFFRAVQDEPRTEFIFLLACLFSVAYASQLVGLAPIVGGFLAGLAFNRLVPETSPLMNRVQFVGDALFIPFFLLSVGMLVDFRVLFTSFEVWGTAAIFTALVLAGKTVAGKVSQWIFRHSAAEGWAIVGLTVPQAAATLAVTLVGFQIELFDQNTVNAVVVLILFTCLIGSVLVERNGRRVALEEETTPYRAGDAPQRILVPLANPDAAEAMMDVAFMIRHRNTDQPVYPLTVTHDGEDAAAQVAAAERMLGYAVIHAAAADVPVIPSTRVDVNVANGISRAIKELRISSIVMGWSGQAGPRNLIFGSILDQLLKQNLQQFIVCRISTPLNTTKRLILAIPPFAEREAGFEDAIQTIKRLAQRIGASFVVSSDEASIARLKNLLARIKPDLPTDFYPVPSIDAWLTPMDPAMTEDDLFVLLAAREGRVSWRPSIDRLPRRIAARAPKVNLLVVYPSELLAEPEIRPSVETLLESAPAAPLFSSERVLLQIAAGKTEEVVQRIIKPVFREQPAVLRAVGEALVRSSEAVPIEVTPGVVLLHAHTTHVDKPMGFVATLEQGIALPRIDRRALVVFVLLTPQNLAAKQHLQCLARIAGLMHSPKNLERLYKARKVDDLREMLQLVD